MFYDQYLFQELHCSNGLLLKSSIPDLMHSSKLVKTSLNEIYYLETAWGYGYPKALNDSSIKDLWNKWSFFCKSKNIVAEIIKLPPFLGDEILETSIFNELHIVSKTCGLNVCLIQNEKIFNKKTRYIIKKASEKLLCREANQLDVEQIYEIYSKSMINLKAEKRFFLSIETFRFLIADKQSKVYMSFFDKKLTGFVCFLFDMETSHYHLSATNDIGKKLNSNYLLLSIAIKESIKRGIKLIHFGGGLTNKEEDNLFKFKSKFSNCYFDYKIALAIHNHNLYEKYRDKNSNKILKLV